MRFIVLVSLMLCISSSYANIKGFRLTKFNIEIEKPIKNDRSPYIKYNSQIDGYLNSNMEMKIFKYNYFSYKIESIFTTHQFRHIGLYLESGLRIKGVDLYFRHYSGHSLDVKLHKDYPESNTIGVRFNFIGE